MAHLDRSFALFVACALAAACGASSDDTGETGPGGADASTDGDGAWSDAAGAGGAGGADGGALECDGAAAACPVGSYCEFPDGRCGRGAKGHCQPYFQGGCGGGVPYCNCEGELNVQACSGVDFDVEGCAASVTPAGAIPCGPWFCLAKFSYCEHDVGAAPRSEWWCRPLPVGCLADGAAVDCGCFDATTACSEGCATTTAGGTSGFVVTCGGG